MPPVVRLLNDIKPAMAPASALAVYILITDTCTSNSGAYIAQLKKLS